MRSGLDQRVGVRAGEEELDLADGVDGGLGEADQPGLAGGDIGALRGLRARLGCLGAGGTGLGEGACLELQGEAIQAQDHAAEAVVDGEEEERGEGRDAGGGDAESESQRRSDVCECLTKGG